MIVLQGQLTSAEVTGLTRPVAAPVRLPGWTPYAIPVGFGAVGLVLGALADVFIPATRGGAWNVGLVLGLATYFLWTVKPRLFRLPRMAAKVERLPWKLVMTAKILGYDFGPASFRVDWTAVAALAPAGETWVFRTPSGDVHAPRRLMSDAGAEQAFLKKALSYLSDAAKASSPDAVRRAG